MILILTCITGMIIWVLSAIFLSGLNRFPPLLFEMLILKSPDQQERLPLQLIFFYCIPVYQAIVAPAISHVI